MPIELAGSFAGSQVLVTGGTGFFGRAFAKAMLVNGAHRVCVLSRGEHQQYLMRQEFDDSRLRFFVGDVRDVDRLVRAMQGVDLVVHAAALKRVEVGEYDAGEMVKTNVMGAMNVIEAAQRAHVRRVVALSTDKACEPVNCYGASKLAAEKLFLAANNASGSGGPRFAVTRYGNVAGSTGSVIPIWRRNLAEDRFCVMTHAAATRFWMTKDEAVQLVMDTAETMHGGELVIPDLPAYRLEDLARAMGIKPDRIQVVGLQPGEKLHESMRPGESSEQARRMSVDELMEGLRHV
jgi:UDP-N-acetylglucosamine 4,6-dehydratase/5-epimerase